MLLSWSVMFSPIFHPLLVL